MKAQETLYANHQFSITSDDMHRLQGWLSRFDEPEAKMLLFMTSEAVEDKVKYRLLTFEEASQAHRQLRLLAKWRQTRPPVKRTTGRTSLQA